jgi:hypothetical protein
MQSERDEALVFPIILIYEKKKKKLKSLPLLCVE